MDMPEHKRWIYNRVDLDWLGISDEFINSIKGFLEVAWKMNIFLNNEKKLVICALNMNGEGCGL